MTISRKTEQSILETVKAELMPDPKKLIAKVFVIHLFSALLTLTVCPQLGFSLIESKVNLMDLFMKLGPHFCDFACGTFFTSISVIFIRWFLSFDEFRFLRYHPFLLSATLVLTSLGFLLMLNPQLFVQFTMLWLLGAISGVVATMEISFRIQRLPH